MKILIALIVVISLLHLAQSGSSRFEDLPILKLPFQMSCDSSMSQVSDEVARPLQGLLPEHQRFVGRFKTAHAFELILTSNPFADFQLFELRTYHFDGQLIDSLDLYPGMCGEDEFFWAISWIQIQSNLTIILADTVNDYTRDSRGDIAPSSIKQSSHRWLFSVSSRGRFVRGSG
jgi:hypothetical protein